MPRPIVTSNRKILDELEEVEEATVAASAEDKLTDRRKIITKTREGADSIKPIHESSSNEQFSWEKFFL